MGGVHWQSLQTSKRFQVRTSSGAKGHNLSGVLRHSLRFCPGDEQTRKLSRQCPKVSFSVTSRIVYSEGALFPAAIPLPSQRFERPPCGVGALPVHRFHGLLAPPAAAFSTTNRCEGPRQDLRKWRAAPEREPRAGRPSIELRLRRRSWWGPPISPHRADFP